MKISFYPTKFFLLLFIIPVIFTILNFYIKIFFYLTILVDILIILVGIIDILISPSYKKIDILIDDRYYFKVNSYNLLNLTFINKNSLKVKFFIKFDFDSSVNREYSNYLFTINEKERKEKQIRIFFNRRGELKCNYIFLKAISLLYFFNIYVKKDINLNIVVLPSISKTNEGLKLLQHKIYLRKGMNKSKEIGDGNDFEMLREYTKYDQYNKIDWKKTAKLRKPVVRIYKMSNFLDIILLIDCGRIMSTEVKGMSLLDYSINSSLLLSYAAIKNNDILSIICFSDSIKKYIPQIKNSKDFNSCRNILAGVDYDFVESNYKEAFIFLSNRVKKRSLVIMFTDIIDDSNIDIFKSSFSILLKRHFVLLILLRDKNLFKIAENIPLKEEDIYKKVAAADMILRREKTIERVKKIGIDVLDIFPKDLSLELINKYIEIKNKN